MVDLVDVNRWISDNQDDFTPPVCNKCMFSDQMKLFFVGGPNSRKDFHMEEGEEFFYQKEGDMILKVIEKGTMHDMKIKEGEIFLLPSRVEHSPQRFEGTIGMVIERERANTEFDCIRYFSGQSALRLYERWFHLVDVVKDLPPLIKEFHRSEEFRSGRPGADSFIINAPYEPRWVRLDRPINVREFIEENRSELLRKPVKIYGAPAYKSEVIMLGEGQYELESGAVELLVWVWETSFAVLEDGDEFYPMKANNMARCAPGGKYRLDLKRGFAITVRMLH